LPLGARGEVKNGPQAADLVDALVRALALLLLDVLLQSRRQVGRIERRVVVLQLLGLLRGVVVRQLRLKVAGSGARVPGFNSMLSKNCRNFITFKTFLLGQKIVKELKIQNSKSQKNGRKFFRPEPFYKIDSCAVTFFFNVSEKQFLCFSEHLRIS
jgi:hypothetical protein